MPAGVQVGVIFRRLDSLHRSRLPLLRRRTPLGLVVPLPPGGGAAHLLPLLAIALLAIGCGFRKGGDAVRLAALAPDVEHTSLQAPATLVGPAVLQGAGGEWLDFRAILEGGARSLRLQPLRAAGGSPEGAKAVDARIYRLADVPIDTNHAGYLRLHGGTGARIHLPRALVPLPRNGEVFSLPPRSSGPARLWVDVEVPRQLSRGMWLSALEALDERGRVVASLPIRIESHGFDLPKERSLVISAPLEWERLASLWPDALGGVSPALVSRTDPGTADAVELLDALVGLAQADRVQVTVPALGGVVKWPAGRPPEAYWRDFDGLVGPWLTGEAFEDGVGLKNWPVPHLEGMDRFSQQARLEYWRTVLAHLEERGCLDRCLLSLAEPYADPSRVRQGPDLGPAQRLAISAEAGRIARAYPEGRIAVPLESDQVRFTGPENPNLFPPGEAQRLVIQSEGLVTDHANRPWPAGLPEPGRAITPSGPTPAPVAGPGSSEQDVRLWAWLAFLRGAGYVAFDGPLPAAEPGWSDPTQLTWFYPGEMFGVDGPVPSVQLKWLRRAQQDYEYLAVARANGEELYARVIARALVRPVRVAGDRQVDPVLPLIAGTPEAVAWRKGLALVAGKIALADPGLAASLPPRFGIDHTTGTTAWLAPRERPVAIVSSTRWDLTEDSAGKRRLALQLGTSIYSPSDAQPEGMVLSFAEMPGAETVSEAIWQDPGAVSVPPISTYEVAQVPVTTSATVEDVGYILPTLQQGPLRLTVRNEFTGASSQVSAVAPAVVVDERRAAPVVDGQLGEWLGNEAIIDGHMVQMHSRPAIHAGQIARGPRPAQVFVGWTSQGLHIAFRFEGARTPMSGFRTTRNFVETEFRRIWAEDVCEILIQPLWTLRDDPVEGPLLHVVAKPDTAFVRRRTDRRAAAQPWQQFESGLVFAASVDEQGVWRGEVTLPWSALRDALTEEQLGELGAEAHPALLRFNLSHHDGETGLSQSWAGPVDYGADEQFTGALILRRPE